MIKYFDLCSISIKTINEIRKSSEDFCRVEDTVDAYDKLMTEDEKKAIINKIRVGKNVTNQEIKDTLGWFLNRWHSHFYHSSISVLQPCLKYVVKIINTHIKNVPLEKLIQKHHINIYDIFSKLCEVPRVGATTSSKILSVIQPKTFVMWDHDIANAYGLANNATGYCRFLSIMKDFITRLRSFEPPSIENRLLPQNRGWKVPIAKILDEWNWVTVHKN